MKGQHWSGLADPADCSLGDGVSRWFRNRNRRRGVSSSGSRGCGRLTGQADRLPGDRDDWCSPRDPFPAAAAKGIAPREVSSTALALRHREPGGTPRRSDHTRPPWFAATNRGARVCARIRAPFALEQKLAHRYDRNVLVIPRAAAEKPGFSVAATLALRLHHPWTACLGPSPRPFQLARHPRGVGSTYRDGLSLLASPFLE